MIKREKEGWIQGHRPRGGRGSVLHPRGLRLMRNSCKNRLGRESGSGGSPCQSGRIAKTWTEWRALFPSLFSLFSFFPILVSFVHHQGLKLRARTHAHPWLVCKFFAKWNVFPTLIYEKHISCRHLHDRGRLNKNFIATLESLGRIAGWTRSQEVTVSWYHVTISPHSRNRRLCGRVRSIFGTLNPPIKNVYVAHSADATDGMHVCRCSKTRDWFLWNALIDLDKDAAPRVLAPNTERTVVGEVGLPTSKASAAPPLSARRKVTHGLSGGTEAYKFVARPAEGSASLRKEDRDYWIFTSYINQLSLGVKL